MDPDGSRSPARISRLAAEAFGTFVLVFGGAGAVLLASQFPTKANTLGIGYVGVALAFGLTVVGAGYAVGHISGGHFNPAVTAGLFIAGKFPKIDVGPYIAAQILGGAIASSALAVIVGGGPAGSFHRAHVSGFASNGFGEHSPGGYNLLAVALIEVILTAVFVYVILGVTDKNAVRRVRTPCHRPDADSDSPDCDPGRWHLGESGPLHRHRPLRRPRSPGAAVGVHPCPTRRRGPGRLHTPEPVHPHHAPHPRPLKRTNTMSDTVTVTELNDTTDPVLVDVREPNEYATGHVKGAINIPLDESGCPGRGRSRRGTRLRHLPIRGSQRRKVPRSSTVSATRPSASTAAPKPGSNKASPSTPNNHPAPPHRRSITMAGRNTVIRSMHDLGLAAWFGGNLMGATGLNGAAAGAKDPVERLTLSALGWKKWAPLQIAALTVHAIGGIGLIGANKGRLATQKEGPYQHRHQADPDPSRRRNHPVVRASREASGRSRRRGHRRNHGAEGNCIEGFGVRAEAAEDPSVGHPGPHRGPDRPCRSAGRTAASRWRAAEVQTPLNPHTPPLGKGAGHGDRQEPDHRAAEKSW